MGQWYPEALQAARNKMNYHQTTSVDFLLNLLSKNTNPKSRHATGLHLNFETMEVQKGRAEMWLSGAAERNGFLH